MLLRKISLAILLVSIFTLGFLLRILPAQWGLHLSEFDPFYHYRVARFITEEGLDAYFNWHDMKSWYPFGRDIALSTPIGLPLASVVIYYVFKIIGLKVSFSDPLDPLLSDTLYVIVVFFPAFFGALTSIALYFLGKEIFGRTEGLLAALLLAVNTTHIGRTSLGFFKHETIGVLLLILVLLLFLKSIKAPTFGKSVFLSTLAGIVLGYFLISWGASLYAINLLPVYVLALLALKRFSPRVSFAFSITIALGLIIAFIVPGPSVRVLKPLYAFPIILAFILIILSNYIHVFRRVLTGKIVYVLPVLTGLSFLVVLLNLQVTADKFLAAIFPVVRNEIIKSVAEHAPITWSLFYANFGPFLILIPAGLYLLVKEKLTEGRILVIVYTLSAIYFASTMSRLAQLLAPAACLLTAYVLIRVIRLAREQVISQRLSKKAINLIYKRYVASTLLMSIVAISMFALYMPIVIESSSHPVTIAASALSPPPRERIIDWLEACKWLRENTGDVVVLAWWDYGYYLTVLGNKTTLADNATINSTQIAIIGRTLLSKEPEALAVFKQYNVDYVVVFSTVHYGRLLGGDEGKWVWMARIAGLKEYDLYDSFLAMYGLFLPLRESVLTKILIHGSLKEHYDLLVGYPLENISPAYISENRLVLIYKVSVS